MGEIEMPPDAMGDPANETEAHVREVSAKVVEAGVTRIDERFVYLTRAVDDFSKAAQHHIEHLGDGTDVDADTSGWVAAIQWAMGTAFPETAPALAAAKATIGTLGIEAWNRHVAGSYKKAQQRLSDYVYALYASASEVQREATRIAREQLPIALEEAWTWVNVSSTDPVWIESMLEYLGLGPDLESVYLAARQVLEEQFYGMYERVVAELEVIPGVGYRNANEAEHDAIQYEQAAYEQAHREDPENRHHTAERAWSDVYRDVGQQ